MQTRTSARTSIRTINKIYKILANDPHIDGTTIIDFGCGKYDDMKEFAEENGYEWWGMDKYNRSEEFNLATQERFDLEYPDIVVCNNVLNVIDDDEELEYIVNGISCESSAVKHFFTIYEGDKTGIGKETKYDCWQRNQKVSEYIPMLKKYFKRVVKIKGESNILCCTN